MCLAYDKLQEDAQNLATNMQVQKSKQSEKWMPIVKQLPDGREILLYWQLSTSFLCQIEHSPEIVNCN